MSRDMSNTRQESAGLQPQQRFKRALPKDVNTRARDT
jgi:hypothetical protein